MAVKASSDSVWYGKIGVPISERRLKLIIDQPSSLIFLIEAKSNSLASAHLVGSSKAMPPQELVPAYYEKRYGDVQTWLQLKDLQPCPIDCLSEYSIASSGATVLSTIKNSMSSFLYKEIIKQNAR